MFDIRKIGKWRITDAPLPLRPQFEVHNNLGNRDPFLLTVHDTYYYIHIERGKYRYLVEFKVEKEFGFDGASCPRLTPIQPLRCAPCGNCHDAGNRERVQDYMRLGLFSVESIGEERDEEDRLALIAWITDNQRLFFDKVLYLHALQNTTLTPVGRLMIYAAVRLFGWLSYLNPKTKVRVAYLKEKARINNG